MRQYYPHILKAICLVLFVTIVLQASSLIRSDGSDAALDFESDLEILNPGSGEATEDAAENSAAPSDKTSESGKTSESEKADTDKTRKSDASNDNSAKPPNPPDKSDSKTESQTAGAKNTAKPETPPNGKTKPKPPTLPDKFRTIDASGVFGRQPVKRPPQPALVGIAGHLAFIRMPDRKEIALAEGETNKGLKLLKIGINRVLIDYQNKQQELVVFSGIGGTSLLPKKGESKK